MSLFETTREGWKFLPKDGLFYLVEKIKITITIANSFGYVFPSSEQLIRLLQYNLFIVTGLTYIEDSAMLVPIPSDPYTALLL